MIRLEVQPYCSECCDFDPDVIKPEKIICSNGFVMVGDTIVRCSYAKRCEAIKRYLSKRINEEKGD
jgi:hypothetical protein